MNRTAMMLGAAVALGLSAATFDIAAAGPAASHGAAPLVATQGALQVEKVQYRRRAVGAYGYAPYRGGYYRGYGRPGISPGAAVGIGVGAAALGILGAAAVAGAAPYPYYATPYPAYGVAAPIYGGCYIAREPMYDGWGNYLGIRRVRVCE